MLDTGQISIYFFFTSAHNYSIPRSKEFSQRMESFSSTRLLRCTSPPTREIGVGSRPQLRGSERDIRRNVSDKADEHTPGEDLDPLDTSTRSPCATLPIEL
ncbi:hypothetical protein EYF80_011150 [Liparis tanakae]|uniref:Uncharacterized protein n=1 Tax=Liparis tanakae TaxID=230148 RepID=A0A4Z2IL40_9TELE|nr:hypothetical protein EYF80_011150 [Liparis tanakae]